MKFLLTAINAKYIHSNPAIYSLRSYAGKNLREHIELAEYTINIRMEQILYDIYKRKPDAVGFSCYVWNFTLIKRLIRELHKILPEVPIWLGGPEVSFEYEQILEAFPEVTGIMAGEGEETFKELLQAYVEYEKGIKKSENKPAEFLEMEPAVPGTVTRSGVYSRMELLPMDKLPFYYEEISAEEEKELQNRIVYYEASRGCPYRCSYCLSSIDKQVRFRNTELVKRELQYFLDKKVKQVKFIDRTFNCNRERAREIWQFLLENDNGVTNFHFEIAAELLTEKELEIFSKMRAGLIQLEIGVQTRNEETLLAIHRSFDGEKLKNMTAAIRSYGNIHQHLDLIAGLPFENLESFKNSFCEVYAMRPNQLQLGFLKVLKGSEMYDRAEEYGIIYQSEPPYEVLSTKWLSYEELQELKKTEEMVELFYNSSQFTHTLPVLEKLFGNAYEMFYEMAVFFEEKGLFIKNPARGYRYEALLEIVERRLKNYGSESERPENSGTETKRLKNFSIEAERLKELFRELLIFDVYLRENVKSRPPYAESQENYRQQIRSFYKKQEKEPDVLAEYVQKGYDSRQMARMTHLEFFHYPVWDKNRLESLKLEEIKRGRAKAVLFDYAKRNPLTYEAEYTIVD